MYIRFLIVNSFYIILSYIQNDLLPASERLPPQTKKKPSGPYNREHLLEYLKKEAKVI